MIDDLEPSLYTLDYAARVMSSGTVEYYYLFTQWLQTTLFPFESFLYLLYKVFLVLQTIGLMVIFPFDLWALQITSNLLPLWSEK